jgi:hypothetical protein
MIMVVLITIYIRLWPCYVKWVNYFELIFFIIILGLYAGALTIMFTGKFYFGWIVSGIITAVALIILLLFIR